MTTYAEAAQTAQKARERVTALKAERDALLALVQEMTDSLGYAEWSGAEMGEEFFLKFIRKYHTKGRALLARIGAK